MLNRVVFLVKRILRIFNIPIPPYDVVLKAEWKFYINYIHQGMTIFDVGAYVGDFTWIYSQLVGKAGHVYAFEASGENSNKLIQLCALMDLKNVTCEHVAVADFSGPIDFHRYGDGYESWGTLASRNFDLLHLEVIPEQQVERISAITLDEYCSKNHIKFIDLLKIDVEGAELQALRGAVELFKGKKIGCCLFEYGSTTFDMGNSPKEITEFFNLVGYKISSLVERSPIFPGNTRQTAQFAMIIARPEEAWNITNVSKAEEGFLDGVGLIRKGVTIILNQIINTVFKK